MEDRNKIKQTRTSLIENIFFILIMLIFFSKDRNRQQKDLISLPTVPYNYHHKQAKSREHV